MVKADFSLTEIRELNTKKALSQKLRQLFISQSLPAKRGFCLISVHFYSDMFPPQQTSLYVSKRREYERENLQREVRPKLFHSAFFLESPKENLPNLHIKVVQVRHNMAGWNWRGRWGRGGGYEPQVISPRSGGSSGETGKMLKGDDNAPPPLLPLNPSSAILILIDFSF